MQDLHRVGRLWEQAITRVVLAEVLMVALGWAWGFAELNRVHWLPDLYIVRPIWVNYPAAAASLTFFAEWLLCLLSATPERGRRTATWVCLALGIYTAWLMRSEPFSRYRGNISFFSDIHLLIPFFIGISFLVRGRAWAGVGAAVVFGAVSLQMIIYNACIKCGHVGFFECSTC